MASTRKGRELALQMFYQLDIRGEPAKQVQQSFRETYPAPDESQGFADALFETYQQRQDEVDRHIRQHTLNWNFDRLAVVDRNILRLAVCEFLMQSTPTVVVIDEAIEIARKFSGQDSTAFVNGVLDSVRKALVDKVGAG